MDNYVEIGDFSTKNDTSIIKYVGKLWISLCKKGLDQTIVYESMVW